MNISTHRVRAAVVKCARVARLVCGDGLVVQLVVGELNRHLKQKGSPGLKVPCSN